MERKDPGNKHDRQKYAPDARWYFRPLCWVQGHNRPVNDKGWTAIYCQLCGKSSGARTLRGYGYLAIYKTQLGLIWLANHLERDRLTNWPPYRRVDGKHLMNLGTKHSCDAYSYEHLKSLVEQDGPDGYGATMTVKQLLSEDGWVELTSDNAEEMHQLIEKSFEEESNRQERKRTMKAAGLPDE